MNGFIAAVVLAATFGLASDETTWTEDYASALSDAKKSPKPLLIVLHESNSPTKSLSHAQKQPQGEELALLKNYHLCRIDISSDYGKEMAARFKASQFPYTVITNKDASKIILRKPGKFDDGQWTTTLVDYRNGIKPGQAQIFRASSRTTSASGRPALLRSPFVDPAECKT